MRALVTGVGGFVGPYLAESFLRDGIECFGTIHATSETRGPLVERTVARIDVRDRSALAEFVASVEPDYVVHLAAISDTPTGREHPGQVFDVNVGGTVNLLEAIRPLRNCPRVLIVSSGAVYGDRDPGPQGFTERDATHPSSTYATSKLVAELVACCYVRDHDLDLVVARPFNHTGPGQTESFVCSSIARQIAESNPRKSTISVRTGALSPRRDFSDVRDVVSAYRLMLERGAKGDTYNVCSGNMFSVEELLRMFADAAGVNVRAEIDATKLRPNEVERLGGDSSKLRTLGWTPRIPLVETLNGLLQFWREKTRVAA